jgi:hypothetical protein
MGEKKIGITEVERIISEVVEEVLLRFWERRFWEYESTRELVEAVLGEVKKELERRLRDDMD